MQDISEEEKVKFTLRFRPIALTLHAMSVCAAVIILSGSMRAQDNRLEPPLPVDPTPLAELMTEREHELIRKARGARKKVEAYMKVAEGRVELAYEAAKVDDTYTAERELEVYKKVISEAWTVASEGQQGKRGGPSKKLEQILLKQIKRLEIIDRLFPVERLPFSQAALTHARQIRVDAINLSFGGSEVLADPDEVRKGLKRPEKPPAKPFMQPAGYSSPAGGQIPGDYLTEEEDEHVRTAQDPDERAKAFMKIADRRLSALNPQPPPDPTNKKETKKAEEELREWGAVPSVSRTELLRHYARAVNEAMAKLEDAYERNPRSSSLTRGLKILQESTERQLRIMESLESVLTEESEIRALADAAEEARRANEGARSALKGR